MTPIATGGGRVNSETLRTTGALLGAQLAVARAIEARAVARTGHDPTTLDLLVRLDIAQEGSLRAVELCRQLMLSPSHVSRRLDRAEQAGLVNRVPDPEDRRAQRVSLSAEGRRVVTEFAPRLGEVVNEVTGGLEAREIDLLVDLLGRIEGAARRAASTTRATQPRPC